MADEKPKETSSALSDYLKSLASKTPTPGSGTKLLMGGEDPELSELLRRILEKGKTVRSSPDFVRALEALQALGESPEAAQKKRAAETNVVDEALANQWLTKHWKSRNCAICGEVTWAMAPAFAHVPLGLIGRGPVGTYQPVRSFPCVVLTCRACGNTLFFNAVAMDLLPAGAE